MKKHPQDLQSFLKSYEFLPEFLRDFHNQKLLFKTMHGTQKPPEDNSLFVHPNWVDGHVYVIDFFLWFMAKHGYILQKSKKNVEFRDLGKAMVDYDKQASDAFFEYLKNRSSTKESQINGSGCEQKNSQSQD